MLDKSAIEALKRAKSVTTMISDSLEEIRQYIEDLQAKREEINSLPVDEETAVARAIHSMQINIAAAQQEVGSPSRFTLAPENYRNRYIPTADLGSLAIAYLGEQLIDAVSAEVRRLYEDRPGVTDKDRQKLLSENDREALDAELAEEAIIRHAEQQGFNVERRADADPRAVLAHERALP